MAVPLAVLAWGALLPLLLLGHAGLRLRPQSPRGLYEKVCVALELSWLALATVWATRTAAPRDWS